LEISVLGNRIIR